MRFLPVCSSWSWATVVGLDDECVLLLQLTVNGALCSQPPFSRCPVQHHGLKGHFLPVDFKSTDFTCEEQHKTIVTGGIQVFCPGVTPAKFICASPAVPEGGNTGHYASKKAIKQVLVQRDGLSAAPGTLLPPPLSVLNGSWKPQRPSIWYQQQQWAKLFLS